MKEDSIFSELAELNSLMVKVLSARYKKLNLNVTPLQSRIIIYIHDNEGKVWQKDLERFIGCNKSTLSSVLSTMEKNGFIERVGSKEDYRQNDIILTDASIDIVNILVEDSTLINNLISDNISEEEISRFKEFTRKVKNNLERM